MAALETPASDIGWPAEDFTLEDAYGNPFRLYDLKGPSGMLVMFICNHCPYVRAIADRIARDALDLQKRGVGVIVVMPNDYVRYPEDAPEQMKHFAQEHNFSFPYVVDETQAVARAYDAVCTPDFLRLQRRPGTAVPRSARCVANHAGAGKPRSATATATRAAAGSRDPGDHGRASLSGPACSSSGPP